MRIGVNCCLLVGESGGVRQYFSRLMHRLLGDGGDQYVFLYLARNLQALNELLPPSWRAHAVQLRTRRDLARLLPGLDLYFCPTGLLYPRPVTIPSVITLVDIQEAYFPRFFTFREHWSRLYHHAASTRLADRVITVSEFSKQSITSFHGVADSKVDVAYPAPGEDEPADIHGTALLSGLPPRFLVYPANFWAHKNHDRLLRALAFAREQHGVVLPCILTGMTVPHGYDAAAGIARYGLRDHVQLLGYQPGAVIATLYRRATALVFPSLFEGFGLPLVEAMAAGCPIACTRGTSLPEVAGDAAVYFDPENPAEMARVLVALWTDDALRQDLARRGRMRVQRFTIDAMVQVHRRAFAAAVEDFRARGPRTEGAMRQLRQLIATGSQALRARLRRGKGPADSC